MNNFFVALPAIYELINFYVEVLFCHSYVYRITLTCKLVCKIDLLLYGVESFKCD